jgi:hypothetical protein
MIRDAILNEILALPLDDRRKLIEIISESLEAAPQQVLQPRVLGLSANPRFWMSDDFDDPLPDEFWFGDETDPLNKK